MKDAASSHLTSHVSRSSFTFFNHVLHSFSRSFIHIACILFLIIIIYFNTLKAPFQWDEGPFIVDNPIIKDLHYFASPSDAKSLPLYRALIVRYVGYLTFALNYKMHGFSVTGYHIVNIAIHAANSVLVYLLVLLTFRTPFFLIRTDSGQAGMTNGGHCHSGLSGINSRFTNSRCFGSTSHDSRSLIAFFSAAIFAAHPLQTEAVTYVFQRFASLVTCFYLFSLTAYIQSRLTEDRRTMLLYYGISFIAAVLAMKTKENAFTLPLVITLFEFCFFNSSSLLPLDKGRMGGVTRRLLYLVPFLLTLLIIPLTLMSLTGTHQLDPGAYGAKEFSQKTYFFTQLRVIITYLRLLFFPVDQNIDYDYPVFKSFFDLPVLLSFVFLSALFGLGVWMIIGNRQWAIGDGTKAKGKEDDPLPSSRFSGLFSRFTSHVSRPFSDSRPLRLMGFGILWFFITLSVESSIIPLPMIIDEYRVYLPSTGMIICVVTGAFWVFSRFTIHVSRFTAFKRFTVVLLVLSIGVLSVATYLRNDLWKDPIRLWEDTAEKSPLIAKPHNNLGLSYQALNMPDKALEQFLIAVKLSPDYALAHYNLGNSYLAFNMNGKAIEQFQIAVNLKPDYAEAYNNLGLAYQAFNMPDKAEEQFLIAIKLKPDDADAHNNLGNSYLAFNMTGKAVEQFLIAIELKPDYAEAHFNLGLAYFKMGQMENARRELITGLNIKPDDRRAQQLLKEVSENEAYLPK